jgi:hypothetical protein
VDIDRTTDGAGAHRVFVVVEPDETRLRHRGAVAEGIEKVVLAVIGLVANAKALDLVEQVIS